VNLLGENIDTAKKNTENLIDASMEVGLEINVQVTKYMLVSRHQSAGQNRNIKRALRICGPKKDEVMGGWRELRNEELRDLCSAPSINDEVEEGEIGEICCTKGEEYIWWPSQRERDH
jgi:hypothetical protein